MKKKLFNQIYVKSGQLMIILLYYFIKPLGSFEITVEDLTSSCVTKDKTLYY